MGITQVQETSTITILSEETLVDENEQTTHFIEILREDTEPIESLRDSKIVERVLPGGTLVNVGVGPELPEHPYEGQVWIKI